MRDGFRIGQKDARVDCVKRGGHPRSANRSFVPSEYDNGYGEGFGRGYENGFDQVHCKFHHGRRP